MTRSFSHRTPLRSCGVDASLLPQLHEGHSSPRRRRRGLRLYDCVCSMAWAFGTSECHLPVDRGLSRSPPTRGRLRVVDGMEIARTSSLSGCEHRVPLRALGVIGGGRNFGGCDLGGNEPGEDALPRQYASHSSPRRHRRDCVSMTASARWRERLELLNVVDWGLSRLPPALRINGDVSRSRFAFASDRWLPMDLVPHLSDGVSATREECPVRARVVPDGSPLVLHRRVAAPWTGTSLC